MIKRERIPDVLDRAREFPWNILASAYIQLTAIVDKGSDRLRFGVGRGLRNRLLSRPLRTLRDLSRINEESSRSTPQGADYRQPQIVLVTRTLGTGGVEAIVAELAGGLPKHGFRVMVLCEKGGSTADSMLAGGIDVVIAPDPEIAAQLVAGLPNDSLIELHNAPEYLVSACIKRGLRLVPVIHSVDVNLNADDWIREAKLADQAAAVVAVSETVREFFAHNTRTKSATPPIVVIPNGVVPLTFVPDEINEARIRLGAVLRMNLDGAILFSCLARYDLQKNIPGLVASFLGAAQEREDVHLLVAGPIEDWLEYSLADALRKSHRCSGQVHLMGTGSSRSLLAASDAFILDSFFEGWPVAATEAAMAGLPLIMSNVGGATELVGKLGERGRLLANPAAPAASITLDQIRRARRRVRNQANQSQLATAVLEVSAKIADWRMARFDLSAQAREWLGSDVMVTGHARLMRQITNSSAMDQL